LESRAEAVCQGIKFPVGDCVAAIVDGRLFSGFCGCPPKKLS